MQKNEAGLLCRKGSSQQAWDDQTLHVPRKGLALGWLLGTNSEPLEYSA